MLSWIMKRLLGYTVITVDGLSIERVINLLLSEGIRVTRVKRSNHTALKLTVAARDEKRALKLISDKGYAYRVLGRGGITNILGMLKKRLALIISIAVAIALIVLFSSHVWIIKIEGLETIEQTRIEEILTENGLTPGVSKSGLDKKKIENQLMISVPELSWVGIEIKGIKATVRLAEMDEPPIMQDKGSPSDIIAKNDGTITKVTVIQGTPMVKEGDIVKKGQLLIKGEEKGGKKRAALGEVHAEVWYKASGASLLYETIAMRTGESVSNQYFVMGGRKLSFTEFDIPYTHYEYTCNDQALGGNLFTGLRWVNEQAYEIEYITNQISTEDAKEIALKYAQDKMNGTIGDSEVLYSNIIYQNIDDKLVTAELFACINEDIAQQKAD